MAALDAVNDPKLWEGFDAKAAVQRTGKCFPFWDEHTDECDGSCNGEENSNG